jgi:CubicO group peptidase (beta-lactamase class C family)
MLARIVERVSGQPFETFLREHLLAPAGMRVTRGYRVLAPIPNMARGYLEWPKISPNSFLHGKWRELYVSKGVPALDALPSP